MPDKIQKICLSTTVGGKEISIQTGTLAKQAGGAVTTHLGGTVLMTTSTCAKSPKNLPFMPMTVEYRERTYAAGKIPGGFFKRETRPKDKDVLFARMTDRPIRPLFPKAWRNETMIYSLLLSMDGINDAGPLSILGASASLLLSDAPMNTAVAGVRIGRYAESKEWVLFPTFEERESLDVEMIVAGKSDAILMVEGGADQVGEDVLLEAMNKAHEAIKELCDLQLKLVEEAKKNGRVIVKMTCEEAEVPELVKNYVLDTARPKVREQLRKGYKDKFELHHHLKEISDAILEDVVKKGETDEAWAGLDKHVWEIIYGLEGEEGRNLIMEEDKRHDGRALDEIRPIHIELGLLPMAHGSATFTRGETQALGVATLGTPGDMQINDDLEGDWKDRFLLHYNFPGFSVGEVKPERGPGRREIGHGTLAKRAMIPLLPDEEDFPYTMRVVSEILESNGSSSMATVSAASLSLFDAGVPLKASCAGVAMGLISQDGKFKVLTDIAGLEDHVGDMDFKVAGTRKGVTAIQMDMKVDGLPISILEKSMEQARVGRLHILEIMEKAIEKPREELSDNAPRLMRLSIPSDKIGALIGPGGKNIRRIQEEYDVNIDVDDDGSVFVGGVDAAGVAQAKAEIEGITAEAEVGKIYKGRVVSCVEFGAFVEIMPGKEGLLHISQIDVKRVEKVTDVLEEGQEIEVKCLEVSKEGKIRLSRKAVISPGSENEGGGPGGRDSRGGPRTGHRASRDRGPRRESSRR
ncbi:MAG: polyribonucleotide nucleotidyltransferase [Elusimicrobia bacterium]|nr:MAG: polyribonucleotide nucleotidyltransferase [Elusimicrobiota bacterium]